MLQGKATKTKKRGFNIIETPEAKEKLFVFRR